MILKNSHPYDTTKGGKKQKKKKNEGTDFKKEDYLTDDINH